MVLPICQEETMMEHGQASPMGHATQPSPQPCIVRETKVKIELLIMFYGHDC